MTRYVIGPDVAMRLSADATAVAGNHQLLAPTLIRSQLLSRLYAAVQAGELTKKEAGRRLDRVRALRLRLLGDRTMQRNAWEIAERLGWPDTQDAEYLALTRLQADAFVTLDAELAAAATQVVPVAPFDVLTR